MKTRSRTLFAAIALAAVTTLGLSACAGEDAAPAAGGAKGGTLNIDFATYNPLSLIIKDKGWLEADLKDQGVTVNWIQSAGSNKANEGLRAGALDVGSTAGAAALLNRANGSEIKAITIANKPEWAALIVGKDSTIADVAELKGKKIAATKGTDPYFFLLQSLESAGLTPQDVTIENLQHADGWSALQGGSVDAWAGLDPIMGGALENGAKFLYRNVDFNSYDVVAATESFIKKSPELVQAVANVYADARAWALKNPEETAKILAETASLDQAVATSVITERTNFDVDPVPGDAQEKVLKIIGPVFVETGDVANQAQVDDALKNLFDPTFAKAAKTTDRS
ncbi:aliphatic sulfonate ABC transporter substrate-binding protein [Mycetocola tolaasinivorans]|uniref:Putative aliphatic sulfonates-binding protein n=1 Tax=Mycetocola tolaasinivorans TaxID=76635 RepID=A0A3L7A8Q6_9MICO|nr:aliphatic sulfonate ABC transporter substrate-binding protein [Mycetocola tolaasinivorans]RLP76786.1 aliphatic sulfonate ABC transporter substrate-binding protein [Mycetocola tolaasinivorans]